MIVVDAHTHLGNDIYAGQWSAEAGAAAAAEYARVMSAAGVNKGFMFTMAGLVQPRLLMKFAAGCIA